ncbi:hypothetical protein BDP67DRAFT_525680 [Colletotrichum lupini]|nr:hypothetical protein BDP67DRAFT_525680 [Colletotrichum lupini]
MAANDNRGNADGTQSRASTVPSPRLHLSSKYGIPIHFHQQRTRHADPYRVQSTVHVVQGDCALGPSHLTFPGTHLLRKD